jgi:glycosyltransferase involved in cell wall biosynthesis
VEREEIRKLYYQCQVLLHPVHAQGGWLAPFEALCAGLPVIVSKELTAAEILRSEGLGTVTDGYENALLDVFTNYEHHRERARKGGEWVRKNLDWSAFCDRMIDIFRDACDEQDRATSRRSP